MSLARYFDHVHRLTTRNIIVSFTFILALMAAVATYFFIIFKSMSGAGNMHWLFRGHSWAFISVPGMLCFAAIMLILASIIRRPSIIRILFFFLFAWLAVLVLPIIQLSTQRCTCDIHTSDIFHCRVVQEFGLNAPWQDEIRISNPFKDLTPFRLNPKGLTSREKQIVRERAASLQAKLRAEGEEDEAVAESGKNDKETNETNIAREQKALLDTEKAKEKPEEEDAKGKPEEENAEGEEETNGRPEEAEQEAKEKQDEPKQEAALLESTAIEARPKQMTAQGSVRVSLLQVEARGRVKSRGNAEELADIPNPEPPSEKDHRTYIQREYQKNFKRRAILQGASLQQTEKSPSKKKDEDEDENENENDDDDDEGDSEDDNGDDDDNDEQVGEIAEGKKAKKRKGGTDFVKDINTWPELISFVKEEFQDSSASSPSPVLMGNDDADCHQVDVEKRHVDVRSLKHLRPLTPDKEASVLQDVKEVFMECTRKLASFASAGCIGVKIVPIGNASYKVCQIKVHDTATSLHVTQSQWDKFGFCFNAFWLGNRKEASYTNYCLEKLADSGNKQDLNREMLDEAASLDVTGAGPAVKKYYSDLSVLFKEYMQFLDVGISRPVKRIKLFSDMIAKCQNEHARLQEYWPIMYKLQLSKVQIKFEDYGQVYDSYIDVSKIQNLPTPPVEISHVSAELALDHHHKTPGYHFASRVATMLKLQGIESTLTLRKKRRDGSGNSEEQVFRRGDDQAFHKLFAETIRAESEWIVEDVEVSLDAVMSEFDRKDGSLAELYRLPMMARFTCKCPANITSKHRGLEVSFEGTSHDQVYQNFAKSFYENPDEPKTETKKQKRLKLLNFDKLAQVACKFTEKEKMATNNIVLSKISWHSLAISRFKYKNGEKNLAFKPFLQYELSGEKLKTSQKAAAIDQRVARLWSSCRCNAQGCIPFKDSRLHAAGLMWCTLEPTTIEDCLGRTTDKFDVGHFIFDSEDGQWTTALCDSFDGVDACKCSGVGMQLSDEDMMKLKGPNYDRSSEDIRAVGGTCEAGASGQQTSISEEHEGDWCFVGPQTTCWESFVSPSKKDHVWKKHIFQPDHPLRRGIRGPGQYLSQLPCHQEKKAAVFEVESKCYFVTTWLVLHFIAMFLLTFLIAVLLLIWLSKRLSDQVHSHIVHTSAFDTSEEEEEEEQEEESSEDQGGGGLFG